MPWDLQTAKQYLNIPAGDATKDATVQRVMATILAAVEQALGRGILYKREMIRYMHVDTDKIRFPRYPVARIHSINKKPYTYGLRYLHQRTGTLELVHVNPGLLSSDGDLIVDYEGGFNPIPSDLLAALWEILVDRWQLIDPNTGGPSAGSGVSTSGAQVNSVSLADFGTVRFDTGGSAGAGSSGDASAAQELEWGWLAPWAWLLYSYRSEAAPTLAFA